MLLFLSYSLVQINISVSGIVHNSSLVLFQSDQYFITLINILLHYCLNSKMSTSAVPDVIKSGLVRFLCYLFIYLFIMFCFK